MLDLVTVRAQRHEHALLSKQACPGVVVQKPSRTLARLLVVLFQLLRLTRSRQVVDTFS